MSRYCSECGDYLDKSDFSSNQWRKGPSARCLDCTRGYNERVTCDECGREFSNQNNLDMHMQTHYWMRCAECGQNVHLRNFSMNQVRKGEGVARCSDCVNTTYECQICFKECKNENNLQQHMQVHQPRNVACPVCGEQRFRSATNAVQHVESGSCSSCRGKDNARDAIYRFVSAKAPQLLNQRAIGYFSDSDEEPPEYPYECSYCSKAFRQLSQQMQHEKDKHGGGSGGQLMLSGW
mmetsp:Transcript_16355/g.39897  ORF Transcript_16355/g.39897 Transcript_16355/m.39897 type:complete len:236 (+) Transcript_16355:62-769(+)